jgi:hypothetical protein
MNVQAAPTKKVNGLKATFQDKRHPHDFTESSCPLHGIGLIFHSAVRAAIAGIVLEYQV